MGFFKVSSLKLHFLPRDFLPRDVRFRRVVLRFRSEDLGAQATTFPLGHLPPFRRRVTLAGDPERARDFFGIVSISFVFQVCFLFFYHASSTNHERGGEARRCCIRRKRSFFA